MKNQMLNLISSEKYTFRNEKNDFYYFIKVGLFVFILLFSFGCGREKKILDKLNAELKYDSIVWKTNVDAKEIYKKYYSNGKLNKIDVLTNDSLLMYVQSYNEKEIRDSLVSYYPNGKVHQMKQYHNIDENLSHLNQLYSFDIQGKIQMDNSFFYSIDSGQNSFQRYDTTAYLIVKYNGGRYDKVNRRLRVIVPEYYIDNDTIKDNNGKILARKYFFDENVEAKIKIYTGNTGKFKMDFIIEEFKDKNEESEPLPMFGSFEYTVN